MTTHLEDLSAVIAENYIFDGTRYPALKNACPAAVRNFAVRHILLHISKSVGMVATEIERTDHGNSFSMETIADRVPKLLIDILRLADVLGISPADLAKAVVTQYAQTTPSLTK